MSSFVEAKAEKYCSKEKVELFLKYNVDRFSRVYPNVSRKRNLNTKLTKA